MANPDDKKISQLSDNPVVLDDDQFSTITARTDGTIGFENVKTPGWKLKDYVNTDAHMHGKTSVPSGTRTDPSIAHEFDSDTGIHFPAEDTLALGSAGVETIIIDPFNNTIIGPMDLVDTTSRDGFIYLPSMNGSPAALPRQIPGKTPLIIDLVNNVGFIFTNGAWRPLGSGTGPTGVAPVIPTPVSKLSALDDVIATGSNRPNNGDSLVWDRAAGRWKPFHPGVEVTIRPDRRTSYPNPSLLPVGHLIVTEDPGEKEIAIVDANHRIEILYSDAETATKIASSSLFQGVVPSIADLAKLPDAAPTNKGFYWTWTGPASTPVTPANFPSGSGFNATLQIGDWIQSIGGSVNGKPAFVHVPSDLMSKLRWMAIGSFQTWRDGNYEADTLVVHNGKFFRASANVTIGDPAPDAGGSWVNITPNYELNELQDVDLTVPPNFDDALVFDGMKWAAKRILDDGTAANQILVWDDNQKKWLPVDNRLQDVSDIKIDTFSEGGVPVFDGLASEFVVRKLLLKELFDCGKLDTAQDGYAPIWDATANEWKPGLAASAISQLTDVVIPKPPSNGSTLSWDATAGKWTPVPYNPLDEYDPAVYYNKGDIVISNDGIWRARQEGKLPEPNRKIDGAYLLIKLPGYSPEEIFQVTTVSNAPPNALTDISSSVSHKFHLEYHDDTNWKVYAYDKTRSVWTELVNATHITWRSIGEPPDPTRPKQITLWIRALKLSHSVPVPAAPEWEHFRVSTSLAALDDVFLEDETPGQTLILGKDGRWRAGSPPAHIPEWSTGAMQYNVGDVTHFEGRFWRATRTGSDLVKPQLAFGSASVIYDNGDQHIVVVRKVSATVLTTPPISLLDGYLRYVSDTDWDFYACHINPTTHAFEWQAVTGAKTIWRHIALPSPGVPPYVTLWIYSMPGSTTAPIAGQTDWSPILLGDFLVSLADVSAANAKVGDTLISDGKGKWEAKAPDAYTKAEMDTKLTSLVTGLSHSTSVIGIVSAPPASPVADEFYIVGPTPTGAFAGKVNQIAYWNGTAWVFATPQANEARMVESEKATYAWNGTAWVKIASGPPPIQSMTKAAYDALATKDPNVIYLTY